MSSGSRKRKRDRGKNLSKELQLCAKLLSLLQGNADAEPFLEPVPWKDLGLDNYLDVIDQPMDLGTVEKKLFGSKYKNYKDFAKDVNLIWSNAKAYNLDDSEIYQQADIFEGLCERKIADIEKEIADAGADKKQAESKESKSARPRKILKVKSGKSEGSGKKSSPRAKAGNVWKDCLDILKQISAKPEAEDFLEPVPWEELGLDNYLDVCPEPMDLGTVQKKLSKRKYKNIDQFAYDVRLIWNNAMKYNLEDSGIYENAKEFLEIFERKFKKLSKAREQKETKTRGKCKTLCDLLMGMSSNRQLGELVMMIKKQNIEALSMKPGNGLLTININKLRPETLDKLIRHAQAATQALEDS